MSIAALLGTHGLGWGDLLALWLHFSVLSLLAVGGAITTAPDMQRYLVGEHGWMSDAQFTAGVAIAQAAPGPNILFVAVMGWHVAGVAGVLATMLGIMGPSSLLAFAVGRYGRRRADSMVLRAFTAGLTPLTLGLLLSTGWVLTAPTRHQPMAVALVLGTVAMSVFSRISPMWLIAAGAVVGALALR
jgi:chromate transporter